MDRFEVRTKIEKDLQEAGLLEKTEPYTNKVAFRNAPTSDRAQTVDAVVSENGSTCQTGLGSSRK
jgi:valyl-tRNA synthetase